MGCQMDIRLNFTVRYCLVICYIFIVHHSFSYQGPPTLPFSLPPISSPLLFPFSLSLVDLLAIYFPQECYFLWVKLYTFPFTYTSFQSVCYVLVKLIYISKLVFSKKAPWLAHYAPIWVKICLAQCSLLNYVQIPILKFSNESLGQTHNTNIHTNIIFPTNT